MYIVSDVRRHDIWSEDYERVNCVCVFLTRVKVGCWIKSPHSRQCWRPPPTPRAALQRDRERIMDSWAAEDPSQLHCRLCRPLLISSDFLSSSCSVRISLVSCGKVFEVFSPATDTRFMRELFYFMKMNKRRAEKKERRLLWGASFFSAFLCCLLYVRVSAFLEDEKLK